MWNFLIAAHTDNCNDENCTVKDDCARLLLEINKRFKKCFFFFFLYANIFYITNLLTSIPAFVDCLGEFWKISGYKVNESKSQAKMLVGDRPTALDNIAPFNWPN